MKKFDKTGSVEDLKKSAEDGGYVSQNCKEAIHEIMKDSGVSIRGVKKTSAERIVDVSIGTTGYSFNGAKRLEIKAIRSPASSWSKTK